MAVTDARDEFVGRSSDSKLSKHRQLPSLLVGNLSCFRRKCLHSASLLASFVTKFAKLSSVIVTETTSIDGIFGTVQKSLVSTKISMVLHTSFLSFPLEAFRLPQHVFMRLVRGKAERWPCRRWYFSCRRCKLSIGCTLKFGSVA